MKHKITIGIGFIPFYKEDAKFFIKIGDSLFIINGKQTSELQPYPAMNVKEDSLINTFKQIIYHLEHKQYLGDE